MSKKALDDKSIEFQIVCTKITDFVFLREYLFILREVRTYSYESVCFVTLVFIHAAPRQGPLTPSLQGVICSSCSSCCCCCCCCGSWSNILGQKRPKTSKNTLFCGIFVFVKEKTLVFTTVLQRQGRKSSKNIAIYTVF